MAFVLANFFYFDAKQALSLVWLAEAPQDPVKALEAPFDIFGNTILLMPYDKFLSLMDSVDLYCRPFRGSVGSLSEFSARHAPNAFAR